MDSWKVHIQTCSASILFLICIILFYVACIFSQPLFCENLCHNQVLAPRESQDCIILCDPCVWLHKSSDKMSSDRITLRCGSRFLVWHCPHSPQSWKFSAWEAPDCLCQLLFHSALNLCRWFGRRLDNRVNEQISNCILMASSLKVPSPLVKCRAIKV